MSFTRNRLDRFSPLGDPESRLQEFRKRFENFSQNPNQMFGDSKIGSRWPDATNNHEMSKNLNHNPKASDAQEEGIPIKVFHEMSDERPNSEANNERKRESMSSSQSHRSSDTSHSSGSAGSVFNSNGVDPNPRQSSSQPRVHHIPIRVEPREGSTSSGYTSTSESNGAPQQPLSRSSSHSSANSADSTGVTIGGPTGDNRAASPAKSVSSEHSTASTDSKPRVRQIPVKIESNVKSSSLPKAKTNPSTEPINKRKSGPFVTRIPVSQQTDSRTNSPPTEPLEEKVVPKADPLETISNILRDLKKYESEVNEFNGTATDKKYRYLDEMLTRFMIKLDTIDTDGNEEVRAARKGAVIAVNKCITLLEAKVFDNNNSNQKVILLNGSAGEPMEVSSTPEPTHETKVAPNEAMKSSQTDLQSNANEVKVCDQNNVINQSLVTNSQRKETAV